MSQGLRAVLSIVCFVMPGCATPRGSGGGASAAAEAAIRQADIAGAKAARSGLEGMMSYYTPDACVLAPNLPTASGTQAVREALRPLFASPGVVLNWQATRVEAARSGDMGYAQGVYQLTTTDPKGKPVTEHGKFVEVWKRQADGSWRCAVDMFNADAPAH